MNLSLSHKLLVSFIAIVVLILIGAGITGSMLIKQYFITAKEKELTAKAYELSRVVNSYHDGKISLEQFKSFLNSVDKFLDARVWVVDDKLTLIGISETNLSPEHPMRRRGMMGTQADMPRGQGRMGGMGMGMWRQNKQAQAENTTPSPNKDSQKITLDLGKNSETPIKLSDIKNMQELNQIIQVNYTNPWAKTYYHPYYEENMIIAAIPLINTTGSQTGAIILNAPLANIDDFLKKIYYYFILIGLTGILFAALLASYLSRGIVRPLKTMQQAASSMAKGDYGAAVNISTSDEIGSLGRSLNSLAKDLGRYVGQMEKTDAMRREFVANVSHELRTPLTIMSGYNQALEDGIITDSGEVKKYRRVMGEEIERLEKLISELLDLSQLEANSQVLELETVDVKEIINNILILLKKRSQECKVTFTTEIQDKENIRPLTADGDRLTQLMLILLDNALKFTPPGGTVKISLAEEKGGLVLAISDTGSGIASEDLPHIWERFYKTGQHQQKQGTGLGLAIAKQILDLHNAQVHVSSQPSQGTTFRIWFPYQ